MENKSQKIFFIHSVIVVALIVGGLYTYNRFGVAATVNGKPISRWEYFKNMEKAGGRQILERMISEEMILGEANKKGIKIDQKVLDEEVAKVEEKIKAQGMTLDEALKAEGMTKEELIKQIMIQKIAEKLANPKTEVTQAEIDDYISKNKTMFTKGMKKEEQEKTAKDQILAQAKSEALMTWMDNLKKETKIIYR